jgi:hypothetical protein
LLEDIANSSQAKGRVERANLTLQDRFVKELRLQHISTIAVANAYARTFIADYNRRFAKPLRNDFDAHRPLREDEDLNLIFTFRELRKVSHALTLQYDKVLYMLTDNTTTRKLIGRYIDVYEYPDGHIELRADGISLPYSLYDKLSEANQGAIVESKRLGHVLQVALVMQEQRARRRGRSAPACTNQRLKPVQLKATPKKKVSRQLNTDDLSMAIQENQQVLLQKRAVPILILK